MKWIVRISVGAALLGLLFLPAAMAQQQGQQQPPKTPVPPAPSAPPAPGTPAAPATPPAPPVNPEEEAAFKAFNDLAKDDSARLAELGEGFLQKYPESRFREHVFSRLVAAYLAMEKVDKMYIIGEKALEMNPDNVDVLARIGFGLSRRLNPNDLDADQKLQKAEKYSKHAIELLAAITKPESIPEEEFTKSKNDLLSMAHGGLGMTYLHRQRYADSATELEQATQLTATPDPADFWLLGVVYLQTKRFGEAVTAYGRCSEMQWAWQEECKKRLEAAKKLAAAQPPAAPKP